MNDHLIPWNNEEDLEEVGARGSLRGRLRRAKKRFRAKLGRRFPMARGARAVRKKPEESRLLLFGGDATRGATPGILRIPITVQELCRVDRLNIVGLEHAEVGPPVTPLDSATWGVLDIQVGTTSQLTALGIIPGTAFEGDNTAYVVGLGFDTIQPGTNFTVTIADAPARAFFRVACFARAVR